ncbi:hypothetical protein ACFL57_04740 [Candidatus Margulisiibacteriota bacterium]
MGKGENSMSEKKTNQFDIEKRQASAHTAAVDNAKSANSAITASQNWLLILGLAQLSFLGSLLLKEEIILPVLIKTLVIVLLLSFVSFILASRLQFTHLVRIARLYERISKNAMHYLIRGISAIEKCPKDLELPEEQIVSSRLSNILFDTSNILVGLSTIGIIWLVINI